MCTTYILEVLVFIIMMYNHLLRWKFKIINNIIMVKERKERYKLHNGTL